MGATGGSGASATQYEVFLSFRGPDTGDNFTDCLYHTMVRQGIVVFRDSGELHADDRIDDLLRAVGNSDICILVLSRNYASSAWCLRELVRAMELNTSTGKPAILPIFFDVMPSDVNLRTGLYAEQLSMHERKHGAEILHRWKAALREVGMIKGWEALGKPHGEVIELVVREVLLKLKVKQRPLDSKLVEMDEQVEAIMELFDVHSSTGVHSVGIHEVGGISKSTLAKIVFNELCPRFDGQCSFIGNIRESSNRNGLVDLQKQLASDLFDSRFVEKLTNADEGIESIRRRAGSKKVLIVLDDLDKKEQFKKLVRGLDTFGSGSRIIIKTRNKWILDEEMGILPYEVKQMDRDKVLELFSLHAFNSASLPNALQILCRQVISTTRGLPLALEVIGSYLRRQKEDMWKEMLYRLKNVLHDEVRDKLKIGYDALGDAKKENFLNIVLLKLKVKQRSLDSKLVEMDKQVEVIPMKTRFERGAPNSSFRQRITSWQKGELLGSGSFGTVYKGFTGSGFFFAVKELSLLDQGSQGKRSLLELVPEISVLSKLQHENIVKYHGTYKDDEKLYIFLELMTEGSLATLYGKHNLSDFHVSEYTRQILNGLKYLHDHNVVHRDIKCANILVDASGSVKLADFGLAKAIEMNDAKSSKGTAYWMAPEVVRPKETGYGLPADIWSLGCTVLEMLTRQHPYSSLEGMQAIFRIGRGELPPVPNSLSGHAQDFILRCLKVNPNDRPSAVELLDDPFVSNPPTSSGFATPRFNNLLS